MSAHGKIYFHIVIIKVYYSRDKQMKMNINSIGRKINFNANTRGIAVPTKAKAFIQLM